MCWIANSSRRRRPPILNSSCTRAEQLELLKGAPAGVRFKIWLKLDSGMNRLGFKGDAFHAAHAALSALPCVQLPFNLCTHLASADSPELPTTAEQLMVFAAATRSLPGERSLGNSAALLSFPDSQADWVRPGLVLYGISPFRGATGADHGLRPVMTLCSRVIAVKDLAEGEQVGYGGDWTATRPTRLAIASVGYGDGYPRSAASGTPILVNGERAGLAGRVSMDMLAIDVTETQSSVQGWRSGRALGRWTSRGGNCPVGGDHSLHVGLRHQSKSRGDLSRIVRIREYC